MGVPDTKHETELLTDLVGHQAVMERLWQGRMHDRLHHGWIFAGPEGVGKFRLAQQIAAWLLSESDDDGLFAGAAETKIAHPSVISRTGDDARLVYAHTHPDLLIIQAEQSEKNKSGQIKTEQVRALNGFFGHSAARKGWRVAIIDSLDQLNRNGMNAMLKLLEEPPKRCVLMLLSARPAQILPTIRSRTIFMPFSALSPEECRQVLHQIWPESDPQNIELLSCLSKGAPGRAVALAEAGILDLFEASCHLLRDPHTKEISFIELAEKWGASGPRNAQKRKAGYYLFESLLSLASLRACGAGQDDVGGFDQIAFVDSAAQALANRHNALALAGWQQKFIQDIKLNEQLYLDFVPVLTKFFTDLHSQTAAI